MRVQKAQTLNYFFLINPFTLINVFKHLFQSKITLLIIVEQKLITLFNIFKNMQFSE